MKPSYKDPAAAEKFLEFINSPDGKIQQEVLEKAISAQIPQSSSPDIVDIGCGTGWLTHILSRTFPQISGCDISPELIANAQDYFPELQFALTDITTQRPFPEKKFDVAILNMALHNCDNQPAALRNVHASLKPDGLVIITIPNPYYAYPVGLWKRNIFSFLLRKKPRLRLRSYNFLARQNRLFTWKKHIPVFFYPLDEQINTMLASGFTLTHIEDIRLEQDSAYFDLRYRLFRFPIFTLLVLKKTTE